MDRQVRIGQLITPFGPGAIYTDRRGTPLVVCGLDHWFKQTDRGLGLVPCQDRKEFEKFEPRLAALLGVDRFCRPPDFRWVRQGQNAAPNPLIYTPAQRFPRWYRNSKTGKMRKFNLNTERLERPADGGRWLPVRFVAVCAGGHLCEFPWKEWIGCTCPGDGELYLTDRGGSELSSIKIECRSCPEGSQARRGRNLAGTTIKPNASAGESSAFEKAGISCPGERPWLGEGANESCSQPLVGALINQTNLYFAKTVSAILLPDLQEQDVTINQLRNEIEEEASICGVARTLWNMNDKPSAVALVKNGLSRRGINREESQIEKALQSLFAPPPAVIADAARPAAPESDLLAFRRAEYNIIRREVNDPQNIPHLRVIRTTVPSELNYWFSRVNLVERLRETRVFYGFDRLDQNVQPLAGMPDSAMHQLFRNPPLDPQDRWLPAIDVYGEGIYIELNEEKINGWYNQNISWLTQRLDDRFISRLGGVFLTLPPLAGADRKWAAKYLLIHSLAHMLINQLVFECGYSTASLRERLFISADANAPMAGILIYTSAGDSEGTLGGLVRLGRSERISAIVHRALSRASWCSADPVCSENLGGQGSRLANLAACHACTLLPETSCETVNEGLDRAMVVGTPYSRQHGFMSNLLDDMFF